MTTHLDTNPSIFSLPALRQTTTHSPTATRRPSVQRSDGAGRGRVPAFVAVLLGNIVLWSTAFIAIGLTLAIQLGIIALIVAAVMR